LRAKIVAKADDYFRNNIPVSRIDDSYLRHVELVRKYSVELANQYGGDPFVAEIAALLHDIGADAGPVHAEESAKTAKDLLEQWGIENSVKDKILSAIIHHSMVQEGEYFVEEVPIEDVVVRDADGIAFLEDTYIFFMAKQLKKMPIDEAKEVSLRKIKGMFNKVKTEKGIEIAKRYYPQAENYINNYHADV